MKYLIVSILVCSTFMLSSCIHHKKALKPTVNTDTVKAVVPPDNDSYVPFTRDLYNRLRAYNIDIRRVQFFIDQQLVLSRNIDVNKAEVTAGVVKFSNGKNINEIVIPALTPGICDSIEADGLKINFDRPGNNFKFLNNKNSPEFFVFSGVNWKDGTCEVLYDKIVYKASCIGCNTVSEVKLMVKQSDMDNTQKKTTVLPGRKIN